MFSAGPAPAMAAPTTPASTGVYKGIGSSPQQSDGTGSGGSIGSKSGMGFWFNIAGGSSSSSSMMGGRRGGGLWGRGAGGGGGVDEVSPAALAR